MTKDDDYIYKLLEEMGLITRDDKRVYYTQKWNQLLLKVDKNTNIGKGEVTLEFYCELISKGMVEALLPYLNDLYTTIYALNMTLMQDFQKTGELTGLRDGQVSSIGK